MLDRSQYGKFYAHQYMASKIALLRAMHDYVLCDLPDVFEEAWLCEGVPDGATDEDYWDIATGDGEFERIVRLFASLVMESADYEE